MPANDGSTRNLSGLVATAVKKWYPHLLRDHEAITNVTHTVLSFPEYHEDLDKDAKYRLANRAAYQVSKESGWRRASQTKKWYRPETALMVTRGKGTVPFVEVIQAKEEKVSLYGNLVARLQDAATHHEVMAILKSEGITGAHLERHVQQMFRDRAKAERRSLRKTPYRRQSFAIVVINSSPIIGTGQRSNLPENSVFQFRLYTWLPKLWACLPRPDSGTFALGS